LIKHTGQENKGNDQKTQNVLMFVQILPTNTIRNIWRAQRGIYTLMLDVMLSDAAFKGFCCEKLFLKKIWQKYSPMIAKVKNLIKQLLFHSFLLNMR